MKVGKLLNPVYAYQRRKLIWTFFKNCRYRGRETIVRNISSFGLKFSSNPRLAALKNKHKGKRGFVLGNGPSLRIEDLSKLRDEITFASNKIYLVFNKTNWRPTYYSFEDSNLALQYWNVIHKLKGFCKLFPDYLDYFVCRDADAIYFHLRWEKLFEREFTYPEAPNFSLDALECVYAGCTVTYPLIQLAWFMGIKELYLIGMDFQYVLPDHASKDRNGALIARGYEDNHFLPNYLEPGDLWSEPRIHMMKKSMEAAKQAYSKNGGEIWNATRGGNLEIFPRVLFDSLF